jgi:hypothetical protein
MAWHAATCYSLGAENTLHSSACMLLVACHILRLAAHLFDLICGDRFLHMNLHSEGAEFESHFGHLLC